MVAIDRTSLEGLGRGLSGKGTAMIAFLNRLRKSEDGATAVEYALIMLIVALGIIGSLQALPGSLNAIWSNVAASL